MYLRSVLYMDIEASICTLILTIASQYLWKFHSLLLVTKPGSLLLHPLLYLASLLSPPPPPPPPWRKLAQHAHNTKHLD